MPVSSIRISEGTGPYLNTWQRTISSVNREDQYVLLGEPAAGSFTATALAVSTATASSHLFQLMSYSTNYTRVHRIWVSQAAAAGSTTRASIAIVRLVSAGTGGTSAGAVAYDVNDTPGATAMSLPSSKGTESSTLYINGITLAATTGTGTWTWEAGPRTKPIIIPSGTSNGLCLKLSTGVATATVNITVEWTETDWQ